MWAQIGAFFFMIIIGLGYDIIGRRYMLVFAYLLVAACLICLPLSTRVYPDFLVMRIVMEIGLRIFFGNTLTPDYIEEKS